MEGALATVAGTFSGARKTILPGLPDASPTPIASGLELGSLLGEGGMGLVRKANQSALDRVVAVKCLREELRSERLTRRLLQEAWTTGALEHPNIVPVYDIQADASGAPLVVLKRIEGSAWSDHLAERAMDLEANLGVLMDVCRAIHFAHRRGFVHRDVKPANVMIGEFGEVYLLDWGIAVALEEDGTGRFPLVEDIQEMAGTPAYMAPEMIAGIAPRIGPWTDVYLLGATLYEVVTGSPPNRGDTLQALLLDALSPPASFEATEPELWAICARAMNPDPSARFETAEQLRLALSGFLRHRGARQLGERAERSLEALRGCLDAGDEAGADAAFAECRFGFRAALEAWPEFEQAQHHLREAEWTMARAELSAGRPVAADRLLSSSSEVPDALRAAVDRALREHAQERASMERWRIDSDEATGRGVRAFVSAVLGIVWIFGPLFRGHLVAASPLGVVGPYLSATVFVGAVFYWARASLMRSKVNRGLVIIVLAVHVADLVLACVAALHGRDLLWVEEILPLIWFTGACVGTWAISRRFWPTCVAMGVLCFAVPSFPEWRHPMASIANAVLLLNTVWANRSLHLLQGRATGRKEVS